MAALLSLYDLKNLCIIVSYCTFYEHVHNYAIFALFQCIFVLFNYCLEVILLSDIVRV